jgi:hypothetical protein
VVKSLNANAQTAVATKLGEEALIVVEVDWGDTITQGVYSDKDYETAEGRIINISGLDTIAKSGQGGTVGDVSITLNDSDGVLKTILDQVDIHKRPARVYQSFASIALSDKFLLLQGEIQSPIVWDEGTKQLSFNIGTIIEDGEIGFSIEEGEYAWVADEAVGKAWPLCFGSVLRVPALRVITAVRGNLLTRYVSISKDDLDQLCDYVETYQSSKTDADAVIANTASTQTDINEAVAIMTTDHVTLSLFLEELITDSDFQENNLRAYALVCEELYLLNIEVETYTTLVTNTTIEISNLSVQLSTLSNQITTIKNTSPIDFDALQTLEDRYDTLETQYDEAVTNLAEYTETLETKQTSVTTKTATKTTLVSTIAKINISTIVVDNGLEWPQGTPIIVVINNMRIRGQFTGNVFTVLDDPELPTDTNIRLGNRDVGDTNPSKFWLAAADASYDLKGKFCLWQGGDVPHYKIIYVNDQDGEECYFEPIVWDISGEVNPTYTLKVFEAEDGFIKETAPFVLSRWLDLCTANRTMSNRWNITVPEFITGTDNLPSVNWGFDVGDTMYIDTAYTDLYVANLIPSTEIKEVLAYRNLDGGKVLVPIPSRYYTAHLNYTIAGQNATVIIFDRPLDQYEQEEWDASKIFVTLVSSEGSNTADIIEYLIDNYTSLSADSTTFAAVETALTNYPSHFALLKRDNAIKTIEDIAWQARCATTIINNVVYIHYIASEPSSQQTITESDIEFGTLRLKYTTTEELVTKLIAKWRTDYSEDERSIVLRNNIPKYGILEKTFNFYIYNIKELVEKSATFWLTRYSNTWKLLDFECFLNVLKLDPLDGITLDFNNTYVADSDITGVIKKVSYNPNDYRLAFEIWTAVRADMMTPYSLAWPADAAAGLEYPTVDDLYAGGAS